MPCEFGLAHYREILESDPKKFGSAKQQRQIIVTHDVDVFPPYAFEVAKIENDLGINGTYYVLPFADFYNASSPANMEIWGKMKEMGHELALHYDSRYSPSLDLAHAYFMRTFGSDSIQIAKHLNGRGPDVQIPSYLHERRQFNDEGYTYIGDSGGWWRFGCVCGHLEKRLVFLSHPVWWVIGNLSFDQLEHDVKLVNANARIKWDEMVRVHRLQNKK